MCYKSKTKAPTTTMATTKADPCATARTEEQKCECQPGKAYNSLYEVCYDTVPLKNAPTRHPTTTTMATTKADPCANARTEKEKCECQPNKVWKSLGRENHCLTFKVGRK